MFEAQPLGGEYVSKVRIMMEVLCFDVKLCEGGRDATETSGSASDSG